MKKALLGISGFVVLGSMFMAIIYPIPAAAAKVSCSSRILTLPCWYRGLPADKNGQPKIDDVRNLAIIGTNVLDMMLQLIGYIAVGFIIWGGFQFMLSDGNPDKAAGARKTIINASVGLLIALASVAIVNFVAGSL